MTHSFLLPKNHFHRQYRTPEVAKASEVAAAAEPTLSAYLNARLKQIGVTHVMAIPGDYIAEWVESLDDPAANPAPSLIRVHPNNEMCATYAADGYGRASGGDGVGCVAFTYGVGALGAVQAVAGAFVENVPLVAVNGSPSQAQFNSQRDQGVLWHHMFDGSRTDIRVFDEVTEMAVRIDNPAYAADLIDSALIACKTASKPVYIEIANTLEGFQIANGSQRLATPLKSAPVPQSSASLDEALAEVMKVITGASKLVVLGGVEIARFGLQDAFAELVTQLDAPYLSTLLGKGILSEYTAPNFAGTYNGRNSQQNVQDLIKAADIVLALGVHETDFNFSGVTTVDFDPEKFSGLPVHNAVEARMGAVRVNAGITPNPLGQLYWGDVALGALIDALNAELKKTPLQKTFPKIQGDVWDIPAPSSYPADDQITWDSFKSQLHHDYLATFSEEQTPVVLADTGLTFYNLNNIKVPENGFIAQLAWGSIGYSPAASYGVKLALNATGQEQRRVVSVSGDGAFSQSLNALGTIGQLGLDNVIFIMANGVFAIEQFLIDGKPFQKAADNPGFVPLTEVPQTMLWNWTDLASGLGGVGYDVTTNAELAEVITTLKGGSPAPATPRGPCAGHVDGSGCCQFAPGLAPTDRASTFTLVAVRNVCADLPSNTKWKLG